MKQIDAIIMDLDSKLFKFNEDLILSQVVDVLNTTSLPRLSSKDRLEVLECLVTNLEKIENNYRNNKTKIKRIYSREDKTVNIYNTNRHLITLLQKLRLSTLKEILAKKTEKGSVNFASLLVTSNFMFLLELTKTLCSCKIKINEGPDSLIDLTNFPMPVQLMLLKLIYKLTTGVKDNISRGLDVNNCFVFIFNIRLTDRVFKVIVDKSNKNGLHPLVQQIKRLENILCLEWYKKGNTNLLPIGDGSTVPENKRPKYPMMVITEEEKVKRDYYNIWTSGNKESK